MGRKAARSKGAGRAKAPRRRPGLRRLLARLVLAAVLIPVLWVAAYRVIDPPGGIYMAQEWWRLGSIARDWRDLDRMSPHLPRAVVAAEDARFCDHWGFDFAAIEAALAASERGGRLRGASTISQQVAKNVFLWHGRSWVRKGLEAGFTVLIELLWPKGRILEVYLNTAEMAEGVFGAEAAARHHFGKGAEALSLTEAARLAAVLPNPKARDAGRPGDFVRRRARAVAGGAGTIAAEGRDACFAGW